MHIVRWFQEGMASTPACLGGERTKISGEWFFDGDLEAYQYVQMFFSDVMGAWSFSVAMISASVRVSLLGT